jgi:hypothetical protein
MLSHSYGCTAGMYDRCTWRIFLGGTQFLKREDTRATNHKGTARITLALAAVFLTCAVYARRWSGRAPISHALPDPPRGIEVDPLCITPIHNTVRSNLTWWVVGTLVAVLPLYKCATHEMTVDTKCACGPERHALEVAVVREAGSWSVSPTRNNLLKRHV